MKKLSIVKLAFIAVLFTYIIQPAALVHATAQTVDVLPTGIVDAAPIVSILGGASLTDHPDPTSASTYIFPNTHEYTVDEDDPNANSGNYVGLFTFASTLDAGVCADATVLNVQAIQNFTPLEDSGGSAELMGFWDNGAGTLVAGTSTGPDGSTFYGSLVRGLYSPAGTPQSLALTLNEVPTATELEDYQVFVNIGQITSTDDDRILINDLRLRVTYDDANCAGGNTQGPGNASGAPENTSAASTALASTGQNQITIVAMSIIFLMLSAKVLQRVITKQ